jgi:methylmalonyl-CoA mutase
MIKNVQEKDHRELNEETRRFSEFPVPSYEEWRQVAEKTLKGGSFEEKLISKTYEGISLQPMYRQEDIEGLSHLSTPPGAVPYVRGPHALGYQEKPWEVSQELLYSTPSEFNEAAKSDLTRGQTMLNLVLDHASAFGLDPDQALPENVGGEGVSISSLKDLNTSLEGIDLEQTPLLVQAGCMGLPIYCMVLAHSQQKGMDIRKLRGCVGMDPLGTLVKEGTLPFSLQNAYDLTAQYTLWAKDKNPELKTILIQGEPYHNAGGNAVQELAYALASGVEYVREMQERGLSVDEIGQSISFSFSVGSNFFMEIAKLRAGRILWSKIIDAFGGNEEVQKMAIHARTSSWTKTLYDPYVNILRGTSEAFAAIVSGVDSLHVSLFNEAAGTPDEFSRRIARNTQIILVKEAHLSKVADPAGGSWYVESLTDSLAKEAWKLFQSIEENGGMCKALEDGIVQEQIKAISDKRFENISRRKDKFVGTNIYPNLSEQKLPNREEDRESVYHSRCLEVSTYRQTNVSQKESIFQALRKNREEKFVETSLKAIQAGVTLGEWVQAICQSDEVLPTIKVLHRHRGAEPFEALRKRAETFKEKNGSYPKVFLANMGPIPQHKARADFAAGFFESGGFEVISNNGFKTVDQAVKSTLKSGASIVVICSNDNAYLELVPPLAQAIKQANREITLFVAGKPASEQAELFKLAGVDEFIHVQSDCYNVLFDLQQQKGIGQ